MRKRLLIAVVASVAALHTSAFGQYAGWTGDTSNTTTPAKAGVFMPAGMAAAFPFHVHVGTNANFVIRPGSDWAGGAGASIDALTDALNVRLPMFIGDPSPVWSARGPNGNTAAVKTVWQWINGKFVLITSQPQRSQCTRCRW